MLRFLRTNGCPWNALTCSAAAAGGHLSLLRWARLNGCPWNENACMEAAKGKHFEILKFYAEESKREEAKRKREDDQH